MDLEECKQYIIESFRLEESKKVRKSCKILFVDLLWNKADSIGEARIEKEKSDEGRQQQKMVKNVNSIDCVSFYLKF